MILNRKETDRLLPRIPDELDIGLGLVRIQTDGTIQGTSVQRNRPEQKKFLWDFYHNQRGGSCNG